ncbi:WD repeat-containing protein DWA2 [Dendrobium catenatum]|uniref:WD repeat-containing protein DWA2 n=1 Tax=Dendrobium catenatum TaxID=906689 RepID=UPI00109FBC99|nr:WD repeat-containing protein DWA2 [Dendrobium catenatum]
MQGGIVYGGLKYQARCIADVSADTDNTSFLAGTVTLKEENEVHFIRLSPYGTELVCEGLFYHPSEIWDLKSCPFDSRIFSTVFTSGETYGASIWEIPELYGQSNAPQLEELVSLKEHASKLKCILWWPRGRHDKVISIDEGNLFLWSIDSSSKTAKVCMEYLDPLNVLGGEVFFWVTFLVAAGNLGQQSVVFRSAGQQDILVGIRGQQAKLQDSSSFDLRQDLDSNQTTGAANLDVWQALDSRSTSFQSWTVTQFRGKQILADSLKGIDVFLTLISWYQQNCPCFFLRKANSIENAHFRDVDYNPKKQHIIVTAEDESGIRIWDLRKPKFPMAELPGHVHWTWAVRYNPEYDDLILTAGTDSAVNLSIRLWM